MGNLTPVLEGVTVGVLAAVVLVLICLIFIKRRRYLKSQAENHDYIPLDTKPSAADFLPDTTDKTTHLVLPTQCETVQPTQCETVQPTQCETVQPTNTRVIWAIPDSIPERPRSVSCPDRRNAISELSPRTEEKDTVETPSIKERRRRRSRRSKTDSCYHVCQIQFTVFYNYYHSKLILQLVCASKVPSTFGLNYGSNIQVELEPRAEKYATDVQLHTNNPVFDETAEFLEISSDELLNMTLKLRLCTIDRFSHSTIVGQVRIPLAELDLNPEKPTTVWRPIVPTDQEPRISSSLLSLKDIVDKGELTLSLKYQILANKVTVVIMKAVNLPCISKIFAIDPYVVVKLLLNLKTVQTKKTSIKRRTTAPIWNEPLVFEIDSKIPISEYSMSFKVKSHNSLSEDLTVGEIEIGNHAEESGGEHWKDMIKRKNQDRAMCHKIK